MGPKIIRIEFCEKTCWDLGWVRMSLDRDIVSAYVSIYVYIYIYIYIERERERERASRPEGSAQIEQACLWHGMLLLIA